MAKVKSRFVCQECGYETFKWMGRCPACSQWNKFVEEAEYVSGGIEKAAVKAVPVNINNIGWEEEGRYSTGIGELDRVLGGGAVKGSLILIGGDPGIGMSTILLQLCRSLGKEISILYVSGEESVRQIKMRADRLKVTNPNLMLLSETNFTVVEKAARADRPSIMIVDSIQTVFCDSLTSAPGSVSQVRETTSRLMRLAKKDNITVIIVGHVTKDGAIAGPRVLEHMVDTVLYFEGERHMTYRIIRAVKNRFGSTNEIGIFEMGDTGLAEVGNPSEMMLSGRSEDAAGSVVAASVEGSRPMLLEIQALVSESGFGVPRRMATGLDYNRITLLIAVLEKKLGMPLSDYDAYVNVAGGLKIDEPACDLAVVIAVASSFRDMPVNRDTVFIGEVGLTGEVRAASQIEKRVTEAMRTGFNRCVIPDANQKALKQFSSRNKIKIDYVSTVGQAIEITLG